jgi:ferredoxin
MISIPRYDWDQKLSELLSTFRIYAPIQNQFSCDYVALNPDHIPEIVYNKPKPVTPLKKFFLPVRENVTREPVQEKPILIIGAPNCDVEALTFLDEIYLDSTFPDPSYRLRREKATIICADCLSINEHCHCLSYGIEPKGNGHSDLSVAMVNGEVILDVFSGKGEALLKAMGIKEPAEPAKEVLQTLAAQSARIMEQLTEINSALPDYQTTGKLLSAAEEDIFHRYSFQCVSCGACSAICPTCSCFLLIDRPGFEKVRQLDTCQYPGFERVAGGEDPLNELAERFRNRYMCKYVWKPEKYEKQACTGCGRCIECCIGEINKNELFVELSK